MLDRTAPPPFVKPTSFKLPAPQYKQLDGGIKLYSLAGVSQEVVKLEVVAEAGKWFETKPGQAHFAAGMLEKGTTSYSSAELAEFFERHGASIEITSGSDFVSVSLYSLARHLKSVVPVFQELLTTPSFDPDELSLMKSIFIQTLKVNNEKTSYLASKLLKRNVFGIDHPYGSSIEEAQVADLDVEDLESFFRHHLQFGKLFVAGNMQMNKLLEALHVLEKMEAPVEKDLTLIPPVAGKSFDKMDRPASVQSSIRLGQRTISRTHFDFPGLLLLNHYLGGFFGSQLMQNLREEKGLTYGVGSSIHSFRNDGLFLIGTDVNKENSDVAVEQIQHELRKICEGDINKNDLELARRHFVGSFQSDFANPFSVLSKIKNLELYQLPSNYYEHLLSTVDSISETELKQIGAKYFDTTQFQTAIVG